MNFSIHENICITDQSSPIYRVTKRLIKAQSKERKRESLSLIIRGILIKQNNYLAPKNHPYKFITYL